MHNILSKNYRVISYNGIMMATNNNEARKKQKITEVVPSTLSFGTVLHEFPDFLSYVLLYIADRVIWNSITSSNKDMHEKSKKALPPWPLCYKLPSDDSKTVMTWSPFYAWSPCGTRIACSCSYNSSNIVIIDQRLGPLRNNGHINAHGGSHINDLKYSPNGRFLVSTGYDGCVKLWDNDVTGIYEQLQEWNFDKIPRLCISACSKYILVSLGTCVFLKDVDGKTIKSFVDETVISKSVFSSNGRAIFICCQQPNNVHIKVWHPYLDDDDEDSLITLWREEDSNRGFQTVTFSNDNTMVAIHDVHRDEGTVWYIDTNHKCLTKKLEFPKSTGLYFTPDGKYIIYNNENGSTLWSIAEGRFKNNTLHFLDNGNNTKHDLSAGCFSPNNRQLTIQESGDRYITSYFVK